MSWLGLMAGSLALLAAVPDDVPRAGRLVDRGQPAAAVVMLSPRAAWSPEVVEGTEVCGPDGRCARVVTALECTAPVCPFGFGTQYQLSENVAELPTLPPVDEELLARLEREPSLVPLMAAVRRHRSPKEPPPHEDPVPEPLLTPEPELPAPVPVPVPAVQQTAAPKPPRETRPPSWIASPGWSFEATGVPLLGVAFDDADDEHFAFGGVVTTGFRYQREIPAKQRIFGAAWLGNQFGADIDLTVVHALGTTQLGVGLDLAARAVYAPQDRTGPNRLRVMSMLDLFTPGIGVLIDRDGTLRPHLRLAGPVSILLRERVGIELRLDMNIMLRDGPVEAYILLGAGVLLRRPWDR